MHQPESFTWPEYLKTVWVILTCCVVAVSGPLGAASVWVETSTLLRGKVATAVSRVDQAVRAHEIPGSNPEAYRSRLSDELKKIRAHEMADKEIEKNILDKKFSSTDSKAIASARGQLINQFLKSLPTEAVLFLDVPVHDSRGESLNRPGVTLVIDHHSIYTPEQPLDNSGFQLLGKLRESMKKHPTQTKAILDDFHRTLVGNVQAVTYSSDNLGDAAETIAIARSDEILKRLVENPVLIDLLEESGRYTDFYVFRGDLYEHANTTERSRQAIMLSKAIMQNHGRLLREAGVSYGDRLEFLKTLEEQGRLLRKATDESEGLLMEATAPDFSTLKAGRVGKLSAEFDRQLGGPHITQSDAAGTSYSMTKQSHRLFLGQLKTDLESVLPSDEVNDAESALIRYTYGHRPVHTQHQFADWSASGIANEFETGGFRPIQFEIAGDSGRDLGKPAIISKAGVQEVDLTPIADALNKKVDEKRKILGDKRNATVLVAPEFTSRGRELVFSFGGHSLSRAEIESIVGHTLAKKGAEIVPPTRP